MSIQIHVTKKLEKLVSKFIVEEELEEAQEHPLGKWTAHVFYVERKKCWLILNRKTKYAVVLNDVKAKDVKNISQLFKDKLRELLIIDGFLISEPLVEKLIGDVELYSTDNDRKSIGAVNDYLAHFESWKSRYFNFDTALFNDLNARLNNTPQKSFNYDNSREEMFKLLKTIDLKSI